MRTPHWRTFDGLTLAVDRELPPEPRTLSPRATPGEAHRWQIQPVAKHSGKPRPAECTDFPIFRNDVRTLDDAEREARDGW